jgi:hypothetical protein
VSRTALGPSQPPIQWVSGSLSLGVKRVGRETDHSSPSSAEVKEWLELYLHSPNTPSWHGARLKKPNFTFTFYFIFSRYSSVGIVTRLLAGRSRFWGSIPNGGWEFSSSPPRPDRFRGTPSLLPNGYQGLFLWRLRRPDSEADNSPPSNAEDNNAYSYTSTPPIRLHGMVLS